MIRYMYIYWEAFPTIRLVNTYFTPRNYHFFIVVFATGRTLKLYSCGIFQVFNAVLLTIVTMLFTISQNLLITTYLYHLTYIYPLLPPFSPLQLPFDSVYGFKGASLVAQLVKNLPVMQGTPVQFLGREDSRGEGIGYPLQYSWASLVAQMVKNPLQCARPGFDPWVRMIPWQRAWQPTPVFLPGESPWTMKPGRLPSMGSQRVRHD